MKSIEIIKVDNDNYIQLGSLVADFRVALKSYKGINSLPDIDAGVREMKEYIDADFPCYVAVYNSEYVGYIVCRVAEPCVWVESIYTKRAFRRMGVATLLFKRLRNWQVFWRGHGIQLCSPEQPRYDRFSSQARIYSYQLGRDSQAV